MKAIFTALLSILATVLPAQERTISGVLTSSEDCTPLPGVNITIKGTQTGTVSDINGFYSIKAPVGSVLVFSFVGMTTKEVLVTAETFSSTPKMKHHRDRRPKPVAFPRSFVEDSISSDAPGVAWLTEKTPTYRNDAPVDPNKIQRIRKFGRTYTILQNAPPNPQKKFGLQFTTSVTAERVNRLPKFQTNYSQGRSGPDGIRWSGPEQREMFSFGPLLNTLEYDGSDYPFDTNGRLVTAGLGNGNRVSPYNNGNIFRTGWTTQHGLLVSAPLRSSATLIADVENLNRSGMLPRSSYARLNASAKLKSLSLSRLWQLSSLIAYNRSSGDLLTRGSNTARIMRSIFLTPPTFDNSNGLSSSEAVRSSASWRLEDGASRSFAPGLIDNPFAQLALLPDREKVERVIGGLSIESTRKAAFALNATFNADDQVSSITHGIPAGFSDSPEGRFTQRRDRQSLLQAIITPSWSWYSNGSDVKLSFSYQTQYNHRQLARTDRFGIGDHWSEADSTAQYSGSVSRMSHDLIFNAVVQRNNLITLRFANRSYFSNTLPRDKYANIQPSFSFSLNLEEPLYLDKELKIFGSISRSLREGPLLYSDWSYSSTDFSSTDFGTFYEATELLLPGGLSPETERKIETGVRLRPHYRIFFELAYYNNQTRNFITPVPSPGGFQLENTAVINNHGWNIQARYDHSYYHNHFTWGSSLTWSQQNSIVKETTSAQDVIPLAGFSNIQSVLAPGQPFGAIYGTTYLRNEDGNIIIDDEGFPVEDPVLKKIGSPLPDWTLGWSASLTWKRLDLSFVFDFRKGGDMWNGTRAELDYYGRSVRSGNERTLSNYVFNGVNVNGAPNTTPVSFYDPSLPIEKNRWVRYGADGVGESFIESTSWTRLSQLALSYTITSRWNAMSRIKSVRISLSAQNLFVITPYSGVDPSTTLFANRFGSGLDLYNGPASRSYHAQITLKI